MTKLGVKWTDEQRRRVSKVDPEHVLGLRAQGLTYRVIAERVGVSRQRIEQICREARNGK